RACPRTSALRLTLFNSSVGVQDLAAIYVNLAVPPTLPSFLHDALPISPTVTAIAASGTGIDANGNGDLDAGHLVHLTLTLSEALTVTGTPTLLLNDGGTASYNSALSNPATGSLVFDYTVASGQNTPDLAVSSFNNLAGVQDLAGNNVNLTGAPTNPAGTLQIDTLPPAITINPVTGDNIINSTEANSGFPISGTESGADNRVVTVTIVDSNGHTVDTYNTTATAGSWSVTVLSTQAQALADGSYTVKADVSDAAGNPAQEALQSITVQESFIVPNNESLFGGTINQNVTNNFTLTLKSNSTEIFNGNVTGTGTLALNN